MYNKCRVFKGATGINKNKALIRKINILKMAEIISKTI